MIMQSKWTPLIYAAEKSKWTPHCNYKSAQSPAVAELLLKAKADVNAADNVSALEGGWCGVPYVWSSW